MGLSEQWGGPCVCSGINLREGGGWTIKEVGLQGRFSFSFF